MTKTNARDRTRVRRRSGIIRKKNKEEEEVDEEKGNRGQKVRYVYEKVGRI